MKSHSSEYLMPTGVQIRLGEWRSPRKFNEVSGEGGCASVVGRQALNAAFRQFENGAGSTGIRGCEFNNML